MSWDFCVTKIGTKDETTEVTDGIKWDIKRLEWAENCSCCNWCVCGVWCARVCVCVSVCVCVRACGVSVCVVRVLWV
jgi:hypothetical protein